MQGFKSTSPNFKQIKHYISFILPALLFIWVLIIILQKFSTTPNYGLDPSWMWALSRANAQDLIFGKDINFTWGTFSFLETGLCLTNIQIFGFAIYSIYKAFVISYFTAYLLKSKKKTAISLNLIFLFFFIDVYALKEFGYIISAIILYYFMLLNENKLIAFFALNIIAFLSIFIKLTLFLTVFPIWLLASIYMAGNGFIFIKSNYKYLLILVMFFLFLMFNINYSWFNFFVTSVEIIRGYLFSMSDAAYNEYTNLLFFLSFLLLNVLFIAFYFGHFLKIKTRGIAIFVFLNYLTLMYVSYVIFKHAYTRFHPPVAQYFMAYIFFILAILFSLEKRNRIISKIFYFEVTIFVFLSGMVNGKRSFPIISTFRSVKNCDLVSKNNKYTLLKPTKFDTLLIADDLRIAYLNRNILIPPTPQNYCTYTDKLDSLNFDYFKSKSIKMILVQKDLLKSGIDNQHPHLYNRWFFENLEYFNLSDSICYGEITYFQFELKGNFVSKGNQKGEFKRFSVNQGDDVSIENSNLSKNRKLVVRFVNASLTNRIYSYLKRPEDLHFIISSKINRRPTNVIRFDIPSNYLNKPLSMDMIFSNFKNDTVLNIKVIGRFKTLGFDIVNNI
jgi:hypothetical protein